MAGEIKLSKEDEIILRRFADEIGVDSGVFMGMVLHAAAKHIKETGTIALPIFITAKPLPTEARGGEPKIFQFEPPKNAG